MVFVRKLSPAFSFLSVKTEMLGSGDQYEISLNDTTKSRQQFKRQTNKVLTIQSFLTTRISTLTRINEIWHRLKFVQSRHSPQVACVANVREEGREKGAHAK